MFYQKNSIIMIINKELNCQIHVLLKKSIIMIINKERNCQIHVLPKKINYNDYQQRT